MNHRRVSIALAALLIGILACNMPGGAATETPTPAEDLAATITAQAETLQAPSATAGPPTETSTAAPTSTSSVPMVSVSSATNCRTGNGTVFQWLFTLNPNNLAEVVGKNTPSGYWIIRYPGGQCWLWGQYATVTGDVSSLPEFPAPATPTPSELAAPSNFHATSSCSPSGVILTKNIHVNLTWTDNAPNEEGYRIYRGGNLLATMAADSTSYADDTTILIIFLIGTPSSTPQPPPSIKYAIEAFNSAGSSQQKELNIGCP